LGFQVTGTFNSGPFINVLISKIKKYEFVLNSAKYYLSFGEFIRMFKGYIIGTLNYGLAHIPLLTKIQIKNIQKCLNRILYKACFIHKKEIINSAQFSLLKICTQQSSGNRQRMLILCGMNKMVLKNTPTNLTNLVRNACIREAFSSRITRTSNSPIYMPLKILNVRNTSLKIMKTFPYTGLEMLHRVPHYIQQKFPSPTYDKLIRHYYKNVCQHDESLSGECPNCLRNHSWDLDNSSNTNFYDVSPPINLSNEFHELNSEASFIENNRLYYLQPQELNVQRINIYLQRFEEN
jgi:hypothetical protein